MKRFEIKSGLIDACRMIEDAKYELTKLSQNEITDTIYLLLNDATIQLRTIILKKYELSNSDQTE